MASCNECIHYDACMKIYQIFTKDTKPYTFTNVCEHFKDKADVVEVKRGKWIYNIKYYSCSICAGKRFNLLLGTDAEFCPYCGAKMDGGEKR